MWAIVLKLEGGSAGIGYDVTVALTNFCLQASFRWDYRRSV